MAEGGQVPSRSILGCSDADFEFTCTPCGEDNVREEAVKYCPECQEYLCNRCTKHHGRQKLSKSHKLVEASEGERGHAFVKTTKCCYHADRNIEMYCGQHDMVYCLKCIATDHRSCKDVVGIEDVKPPRSVNDDTQRLTIAARDVLAQLTEADENKRRNIEDVVKQKNEALETIRRREEELIAHIRKISTQAVDSVEKHCSDITSELKSDVMEIENITKEVEKSTYQLDTVASMDTQQKFVHIKLIENSIRSGKKIIENKSNETKALSFIEIIDFDKIVTNSASLGRVEVIVKRNKTPQKYNVKSREKINVKLSSDCDTCYISDIYQLPDGTILLTDWNNKKVKRLNSNYDICDHCDLDAPPTGICLTGKKEVVVKMNNNKVQFISVDTSMVKSRQFSIEGVGYWGIAYWNDSLWVCSSRKGVNVYSTSGTLLKSVINDAHGKPMFKNNTGQMSVTRDVLIVTDRSDGAVCLSREGEVQQEIRNWKLNGCYGVTVSGDGTVFLSGWISHNVMMFRPDGTCLGELVSKNDGLTNPLALHFDKQRNSLMVSCVGSDNITLLMFD